MADSIQALAARLQEKFAGGISACGIALGELTVDLAPDTLIEIATALRDGSEFAFEQLMDLCGVDYSAYGRTEWSTEEATEAGFSRGVEREHPERDPKDARQGPRFAVVYHLLSIARNQRLRLRVFAPDDQFPVVPSVTDIWASANWYEREAFDLIGIVFEGHPDLRRILTDYGFVGHPFRKDFPLIGNVEVRYDPQKQRVVYQPVSIEPRVLVPRVIRHDNRYAGKPRGAADA